MYLNNKFPTFLIMILFSVTALSCGGSGGGGNDDNDDNNGASITVALISPEDAASSVAVDSSVVATFSGAITETTLDGNFTLTCVGASVIGQTTWDAANLQATFDPDNNLAEGASCTVSLGEQITGTDGTALTAFTSTFTTVTTTPTVLSLKDASGTALTAGSYIPHGDGNLTTTFSEAMDPATVTTSLTCNGVSITGTVGNSGAEYTFTYEGLSQNSCVFTITGGSGGAADLYGNTLAETSTYNLVSDCGPDDPFDTSANLGNCWTEVDAGDNADIDINESATGALAFAHDENITEAAPPHIYKDVAGDFAVVAFFDNVSVNANNEILYLGVADGTANASNELLLEFGEHTFPGTQQVILYKKTEDGTAGDDTVVITVTNPGTSIYLCIVNDGGSLTGSYSTDGTTFTLIDNATVDIGPSTSYISIGGYGETGVDGFSFESPGIEFNEGTTSCAYTGE